MKVRYLLPAFVALVGCTPAQISAWVQWHEDDPEAAIEFANRPEVQAELNSSDSSQFVLYLIGNCSSYQPLFEKYGLPVNTFTQIAWRESGCNHTSFVRDHDDLGGGLLGINLRAGASMWNNWCGLTADNVTNAEKNVECAAAAYSRLGLKPWQ